MSSNVFYIFYIDSIIAADWAFYNQHAPAVRPGFYTILESSANFDYQIVHSATFNCQAPS
jgi:hypothetical protein